MAHDAALGGSHCPSLSFPTSDLGEGWPLTITVTLCPSLLRKHLSKARQGCVLV